MRRGFENGVKKDIISARIKVRTLKILNTPLYYYVNIYVGLCVFELDEELMSMCVNVFYALHVYLEFEVHPLKLDNNNSNLQIQEISKIVIS